MPTAKSNPSRSDWSPASNNATDTPRFNGGGTQIFEPSKDFRNIKLQNKSKVRSKVFSKNKEEASVQVSQVTGGFVEEDMPDDEDDDDYFDAG